MAKYAYPVPRHFTQLTLINAYLVELVLLYYHLHGKSHLEVNDDQVDCNCYCNCLMQFEPDSRAQPADHRQFFGAHRRNQRDNLATRGDRRVN